MGRQYGMGCKKDESDDRDVLFAEFLMTAPQHREVSKPSAIDYTNEMSPVRDQDGEGTCVAFACTVGLMEYLEKKRGSEVLLSPRYVYCNARKEWRPNDREGGTSIRAGMKVLNHKGACTEECWPYEPHSDDPEYSDYVVPCTAPMDNPCDKADEEAASHRIKNYTRLSNLKEIKESLYLNGPCVLGVEAFPNWFKSPTKNNGHLKFPKGEDKNKGGGHAICIVGYNDDKKWLKFKNSWGIEWGDGGYGYMSYDYFAEYFWDAWTTSDLLPDIKPLVELKKEFSKTLISKHISFSKI